MKTMTAARFKKNCSEILDEMSRSGEPVLITKKGKPIAKLVSADATTSHHVFGAFEAR